MINFCKHLQLNATRRYFWYIWLLCKFISITGTCISPETDFSSAYCMFVFEGYNCSTHNSFNIGSFNFCGTPTFLSYKVSGLRSLLKLQDFAVLLASPNNCHGVSWVSTWLCLVVPVRTMRQMWIAWQSATVPNMSISHVLQSEWRWRRGPWGEEDTHLRSTGVFLKNFHPLRSCKKYQDPFFFSSKRYQSLQNTLSPCVIFFSAQYPKRHCKSSRFGLFEAEHP